MIARNFFGGGAADFGCCGFFRLGTPGFQFNRDRTILNPDQNGDGNITPGEQLLFFLDGVQSFGARDTIPLAFGSAIRRLTANPALASDPNFPLTLPGETIPGCINSVRDDTPTSAGFVCRADGTFSYNFVANSINNQAAAIKTDFFDFRARLEYDITPENLVYGVVSRGHKAASFNDNLGPLGPAPFFRPESVTLYELGTKNEFTVFGRPAVLNLSAFYNDYHDQQLTALLSVASIIEQITVDGQLIDVTGPQVIPDGFNRDQVVAFTYNAANSETYGIQGSGSVILPYSFKFGADFLYLEAKVKDAEPVQDFRFQADVNSTDAIRRPIAGRRLPYAPKLQLNASLAKVFAISGPLEGLADVLVSVSYRSGSFATIFNSIDFAFHNQEVIPAGQPNAGQIRVPVPRASLNDRIPSYALVNLAAGFTHKQFRLEGFVNNVFDKTVAAGLLVSQFSNTRFFTGPRVVGARARVNF